MPTLSEGKKLTVNAMDAARDYLTSTGGAASLVDEIDCHPSLRDDMRQAC